MSAIESFLFNKNLTGFYIGFVAMIIFPILNFFVSRDLFQNKLKLDANKANTYSAVVSVVTIYLLLFFYIVYYYREDFKQVFCKKKRVVVAPQSGNIKKEK